MKTINWKDVVEWLGGLAIVASLVFVGLQMRQAQQIALADSYLSLLASNVEISSGINQYAEIWVRGTSGEKLDPVEETIFANLVVNLNDKALVDVRRARRLREADLAETILHDFVAFLYQNPGARRVWAAREENLMEHRRMLIPDGEHFSWWSAAIQDGLARLELIED